MGPYFSHLPTSGTSVADAFSDLGLIEFMPPMTMGTHLIFQVLSDGLPVGYARLERDSATSSPHYAGIDHLLSSPPIKDYILRTIQIHQQFRRRGIGSRLLQEVAGYCREHQVQRISCSLEGNALLLRRWYLRNGFTCRDESELELLLR